MKTLLLMRHATALDGVIDVERPLSPFGREDAEAAGAFLADYSISQAYHSPALRTRTTAELAQAGGAGIAAIAALPALYNARAHVFVGLVEGLSDAQESVLIVAHEPGVADAARELCRADQRTPSRFTQAGIAVLRFDGPWVEAPGNMVMDRFVARP